MAVETGEGIAEGEEIAEEGGAVVVETVVVETVVVEAVVVEVVVEEAMEEEAVEVPAVAAEMLEETAEGAAVAAGNLEALLPMAVVGALRPSLIVVVVQGAPLPALRALSLLRAAVPRRVVQMAARKTLAAQFPPVLSMSTMVRGRPGVYLPWGCRLYRKP